MGMGQPRVSEKVPTEMRRFPVGFDSGGVTDVAAGGGTASVATSIQAPFRGVRLVVEPAIASAFFLVSVFVGTAFQGAATANVICTLFVPESLVPLELDTAQVGNTITLNVLNRSAAPLRFAGGMVGETLR